MERETRQRGNLSDDIEAASYSNKMHVGVAGLQRVSGCGWTGGA